MDRWTLLKSMSGFCFLGRRGAAHSNKHRGHHPGIQREDTVCFSQIFKLLRKFWLEVIYVEWVWTWSVLHQACVLFSLKRACCFPSSVRAVFPQHHEEKERAECEACGLFSLNMTPYQACTSGPFLSRCLLPLLSFCWMPARKREINDEAGTGIATNTQKQLNLGTCPIDSKLHNTQGKNFGQAWRCTLENKSRGAWYPCVRAPVLFLSYIKLEPARR